MSKSLTSVFKNAEQKEKGGSSANIVSLLFKTNKRTGSKNAWAVLDNGQTLFKSVTNSGVVHEAVTQIPAITNTAQRNILIKDLANQNIFTQENIANMLHISQSTVSKVLNEK